MPRIASLDDLFVRELQEAYHAEGQILKALPGMVAAAASPDLKIAFEEHRQETVEHLHRLERVFGFLRVTAHATASHGMAGLLAEAGRLIQVEADPDLMDIALIGAAQKVEHFEIASYGSLCSYAEMLGYAEAHDLLGRTLDEEESIDMRLTELAEAVINPRAFEGEQA